MQVIGGYGSVLEMDFIPKELDLIAVGDAHGLNNKPLSTLLRVEPLSRSATLSRSLSLQLDFVGVAHGY